MIYSFLYVLVFSVALVLIQKIKRMTTFPFFTSHFCFLLQLRPQQQSLTPILD